MLTAQNSLLGVNQRKWWYNYLTAIKINKLEINIYKK